MRILILVILLTLPLLAGCGSENTLPSTAEVQKPADKPPGVAVQAFAPGFQVIISPDRLPSGETAKTLVSGCNGSLRYVWEVNGLVVADASGESLLPANFRRDDEVLVRVECKGATATAATRVINSPPRVVRVKFKNPVIVSGKAIEVLPEAVDHDDDPVEFEYKWIVAGEEVPVDGAELPGSYVRTGHQIAVYVTATDGAGKSFPYQGEPFIVPSAAPRFTTQPPQSFQLDEYRYQARAVDPDGDRVTYRLEEAPRGMAIDSASGLVTWTIVPGISGDFRVKIVAEDATGLMASQEYAFSLKRME